MKIPFDDMTDKQTQLDKARADIDAGNCGAAVPILLPLAESGNTEAHFLLGYMYFTSCEYPFTEADARDWLVKAKEQGHAEACYHLAWFPNAQGISVIEDMEAVSLLIEAGERGSVTAQRDLGAYFATGDWIGEKDEAKAIKWYTKAAEQGHAESQYDLGFMLLLGEGTDQNTLKGMEWLIRAAEQGNDSACELLVDIYEDGKFGVASNAEKAKHWKEAWFKPKPHHSMRRQIIVTGIPASGKSTIGQAVASALGLPMLDKDEILEALFNSQGLGNAEWRTRLSRAADEVLQERALRSGGAVITSWWRHPESRVDSGTPVEWLSSLPGIVVELHCVCSPQVATERFLSRRRHEGHLDRFKTHAEVLASFQEHAALGPLGLGRVVRVNTERSVELGTLLAEIEFAPKGDSHESGPV